MSLAITKDVQGQSCLDCHSCRVGHISSAHIKKRRRQAFVLYFVSFFRDLDEASGLLISRPAKKQKTYRICVILI